MSATQIQLYDTMSREKRVFEPLDPSDVRLYVCGPTVYDYAHIGNARPAIVFDVLFRVLRYVYGADHVRYVRNVTDVEDKINERAARDGVSIRELTERTHRQYQEDVRDLGCLDPTVEPRATEHIHDMLAIIDALVEKGHAYEAEGHVLFHVPSMGGYGQLSKRSLEDMQAGARVEVAPYKKDPMDFVLWKPSTDDQPGWDSAYGRGRPGWHIECSAMSEKHLGRVFDIHGGGVDLIFPHHENEIAQSRCAHGSDTMARYWMHNGFLQVEGKKMSKSLGNFFTIRELLDQWPGETLRLQMLMSQYRQPTDFTQARNDEAQETLDKWYAALEAVEDRPAREIAQEDPHGIEGCVPETVLSALADDLNTPAAIAAMHQLANEAAKGDAAAARGLKASGLILGMLRHSAAEWRAEREAKGLAGVDKEKIDALIAERTAARKSKDFARADAIRDELAAMNIEIMDGPGGTTWSVR